jgi:hypothetical protein
MLLKKPTDFVYLLKYTKVINFCLTNCAKPLIMKTEKGRRTHKMRIDTPPNLSEK